MPPAKKVSLCNAFIKGEDLKIKVCGKVLASDGLGGLRCPDRDEHMLKHKTGFCANGNCEGSAKKSPSGRAMKTCSWWKRCPCDCHKTYDMMFGMSGMERVLVDNSGYSPDHGQFKMPTLEERMAMIASSMVGGHTAPTVIESPAPEVVPPTVARSFAPTATGRAARGELAAWVKLECDVWLIDNPEYSCTPAYLSEAIAKTQGLGKAPSVGAVDAVLKRWAEIGFAVMEKKPTRFIKYTDDGVKLGLEGCLERAKRNRRSKAAEAGRSFHR